METGSPAHVNLNVINKLVSVDRGTGVFSTRWRNQKLISRRMSLFYLQYFKRSWNGKTPPAYTILIYSSILLDHSLISGEIPWVVARSVEKNV